MRFSLTRFFPTPNFFDIPSAGIDFSDSTMRFIKLAKKPNGIMPEEYAEKTIPEGCMKDGKIIDNQKFVTFLSDIKKKFNLKYVRVSIPESQIYSFTLSLDVVVSNDIRSAIEIVIEDNIPLKTIETIFDYHILSTTDDTILVQVVAISEVVSRMYFEAFMSSGMVPVSFELEGQAIARAVIKPNDNKSYMVVDFGANRTEITILTKGSAIYTATLDFGGKNFTKTIAKELNISEEEAIKIKKDQGLNLSSGDKTLFNAMSKDLNILTEEINKRYIYWHEKKSQIENFDQIETIYLCGGHSNLLGLDDYLKNSLKLNVVQVNPWINCLSFEDAIPGMSREMSMSYVTAIGLALADYIYD